MSGSHTLLKQFALRHLRERSLRAMLTVGAISIGVALVLAVGVVSTTLVQSVRASATDVAGGALIEVSSIDQAGMPADVLDQVMVVEGVEQAAPVLRSSTRMTGPEDDVRTHILGVTPALLDLFSDREGDPTYLRLQGELDASGPTVIVSAGLARRTGASVSGEAFLDAPEGVTPVAVTGNIEGPALADVNAGEFGLMPLEQAQRLFLREDRISSVYVTPDATMEAHEVMDRIADALGDSVRVGVPGERLETFEAGFRPLIALVALGSGMGFVVAVAIVFNATGIAVTERRRELATARLLGASRRQLWYVLIAETVCLGVVGAVLGAVLGIGLAYLLVEPVSGAYDFVLPDTAVGAVSLTPADILVPMAGGVLVATVGALAALRRLRLIAPIEVLRPQSIVEQQMAERRFQARLGLRVLLGTALVTAGVASLGLYAATDADAATPVAVAMMLVTATVAILMFVPDIMRACARGLVRSFGAKGRLASAALVGYERRTAVTAAFIMMPVAMAVAIGAAIGSYDKQAKTDAYDWHGAPLKVSSDSFSIFGSDQPLEADLGEVLTEIDGVDHTYPERRLLLDVDGEPVALYAIPIAQSLRDQTQPWISPLRADQEELVAGLDSGEVVISKFAADRRGLSAGDDYTVPTPSGLRHFPIAGVYDDLTTFESVFIEYRHYHSIWGDSTADELSLVLAPGTSVSEVSPAVEDLVASRDLPAVVLTRDEKVADVLETVAGLTALARTVQFVALAAAALAFSNALFTMVHDRRWHLALARLVGMSRRDLGRTVMLEAASVGTVGAVLGVVLGMPLGWLLLRAIELRFSWNVSFEIPWLVVFTTMVLAIVIVAIATIHPRRTATRMPLIEALRSE